MSASNEIGFVFQCVLCGSYSIFALDALDPFEVSRYTTSGGKKVLQKNVHSAEEMLIERVQRRCAPDSALASPKDVTGGVGACRFAWLPCAACIEIYTDTLYTEWLEDKSNLNEPVLLLPHAAVIFEEGELPPAYMHRAGKWHLAQGVGPKDLEHKVPNRLPAGQFRVLLPSTASPIRPPCWKRSTDGEDDDQFELWQRRRTIIETVSELYDTMSPEVHEARTVRSRASKNDPVAHAPSLCAVPAWVSELCCAAEEAWNEQQELPTGKSRRKTQVGALRSGACYQRAPLLSSSEVVLSMVCDMVHRPYG